jgi:hypothetical protein
MSTHYCSCLGGTDSDSTKSASGHVTPNLCFGIRRCVLGMKRRRMEHNRLNKKTTGTCYAKHVFLYPLGYVGHVVHSGASGA